MGGCCFSVRWSLSCSKYHTELVKYFAFINNLNILSLCFDRSLILMNDFYSHRNCNQRQYREYHWHSQTVAHNNEFGSNYNLFVYWDSRKIYSCNTEVWLFAMFIDSFASEGPKYKVEIYVGWWYFRQMNTNNIWAGFVWYGRHSWTC